MIRKLVTLRYRIWLSDLWMYPLNVLSDNIRDKLIAKGIVNKYGGTGTIRFSKDGKTANEYLVFSDPIGITFDKETKKYVETHTIQIKYCDGGVHIFPTADKEV